MSVNSQLRNKDSTKKNVEFEQHKKDQIPLHEDDSSWRGELTLNLTAHKTQQHSNYRFHKSSHAMSHRAATGKEGIQRTSDNEK